MFSNIKMEEYMESELSGTFQLKLCAKLLNMRNNNETTVDMQTC